MDAEIARALSGALARGAITAILVGALLLAAGRFGRRAAGLLTGLPTVTGPAMLWLVYDRGEAFTAAAYQLDDVKTEGAFDHPANAVGLQTECCTFKLRNHIAPSKFGQ